MVESGKKTILLVEDEAIIALASKLILEKHGYAVRLASGGEQALATVANSPGIDLVLMDINLGRGMDGTEAAQRILSLRDLPLIFLSSHSERELVEKTEQISSYGYIVKNSGETILLASIKMAFRLYDARTALRDREEHYRSLFEKSGDQVWIEDFSAFKARVDELRAAGHTDFRAWLKEHPQELLNLADLVRVVDLNHQALRSIGLGVGAERPRTLRAFLGPDALGFFGEELAVLAEGGVNFETEILAPESGSEPGLYLLSVNVLGGHQARLDRVHVFIHDLNGVRRLEGALEKQKQLQQLLVELSAAYINLPPENIAATIRSSLQAMAQTVGMDRAYIFAYDFEHAQADNTYEWCAPGIAPQMADLQGIPLKLMAEAVELHRQGKAHYIPDIAALPGGDARSLLEGQGIRSLLTMPLMDGDDCLGCVGFDAVHDPYAFSGNERALLTVFARLLVNVLQRQQTAVELKTMYDHSPVLMCVLDEQQRVLFANPAFSALAGVPESDLKGSRVCSLLDCLDAPEDRRGSGPECASCALKTAMEDSLATGRARQNIFIRMILRRQGGRQEATLQCATALLRDGERKRLLLSLMDVTEQKWTEKALRDRERYLSAILETSQDGFWVLDDTGKVSDVNAAYCRMSGYSREELLRLSIPDLEAEETPSDTAARIGRIIAGGSELFETRHRRKDGSLFDVEVSAGWLGADLRCFVCFCRDITGRRRSEKQIADLLKEKELLLKESQHRIKNNLQTIHSLLTLKADEQAASADGNALLGAAGHVFSMMRLYDALFRADAAGEVPVRVFLPGLIGEIAGSFPAAERVKMDVEVDDFMLDAKILSPLGMLINELITNSMEYAFRGRDHGRIGFSARKDGSRVTIRYADDGVGLPETVSLHESTGFGLNLVRLLTEQIRGRISVDRSEGTGYTIEFEER